MASVDKWHASPCREAATTADDRTGEIRVPLELFRTDQLQGAVELVLSRREARELYAALYELINHSTGSGTAGALGSEGGW